MISQERLDAIVMNALIDGKNADQVSKQTGVPVERVQLAMHKARGKDPAEANKETQKKNRQNMNRATGGASYAGLKLYGPRQIGPNSHRGRRAR